MCLVPGELSSHVAGGIDGSSKSRLPETLQDRGTIQTTRPGAAFLSCSAALSWKLPQESRSFQVGPGRAFPTGSQRGKWESWSGPLVGLLEVVALVRGDQVNREMVQN